MTDRPSPLPPASPAEERLLVPVGCRHLPAAMIAYAERRASQGRTVSVCLLHVEARLGLWASLRAFRSGETSTRHAAEPLLQAACNRLAAAGVPHAVYLRSGDVVFAILDAAEQLACTAIVVPQAPAGGWCWLGGGMRAALHAAQRGIPVIAVGADGMPLRPRTG